MLWIIQVGKLHFITPTNSYVSCYYSKRGGKCSSMNVQTHRKPGIPLLDVGIQDLAIKLKCLHYTAIYSLCPYQRKPASLLHMQMQKPNKPVVADLSQYIKNQLPITLLDLILWWDVLWLNMKLPAEGSQYTRLQKF